MTSSCRIASPRTTFIVRAHTHAIRVRRARNLFFGRRHNIYYIYSKYTAQYTAYMYTAI